MTIQFNMLDTEFVIINVTLLQCAFYFENISSSHIRRFHKTAAKNKY